MLLTGGADEAALHERVLALVPADVGDRVASAAGRTSLLGLVALLRRARLLVCNDTGVLHLGRAIGTPLVALLGPENNRRWGPYAFAPSPAISLRHVIPCAPCAKPTCSSLFCLQLLSVAQVVQAALDVLAMDPGRPFFERRFRRHDWAALASAGFALPRVTVLVPPESIVRAGDLAAQDYPHVEVVAVAPPDVDPAAVAALVQSAAARPVRVRRTAAAGTAALTEARQGHGDRLVLALGTVPWPPAWISDRVAEAMRRLDPEPAAVPRPAAAPVDVRFPAGPVALPT